MKTIARHISSLLYDHECVIVPHLGAFLTNEVGASIDVNRGLLLPPRKEIVFNAQLSHNDGVLINAVAQSEGITFSEASKNIEAFVGNIMEQLRSGEVVSLPTLGKLALLNNGVITFSVDSKCNYLAESYGLQTISAAVLPERSVGMVRIGDYSRYKRIAGWAAAVALLFCFGPKLNDMPLQERNVDTYASLASVFETSVVADNENAEDGNIFYSVSDEISEGQNVEQLHYHIIVGSYPTRAKALRRMAELEKQGVSDIELITATDSKYVRLSVASFATQEEAREQNRIIRKIQGMEKAWVLKD